MTTTTTMRTATTTPAATGREGVIPWTAISQDQARQGGEAAGKRLLWFAEWQLAFSGPSVHNWPWGDDFEPAQGCQVDQTGGAYPNGACCPTVCGD